MISGLKQARPERGVGGQRAGGAEGGAIREGVGTCNSRSNSECDSGDLAPNGETGIAPAAAVEDSRHAIDAVPDVLEAEIERRQAEADHVGRPEIADHAVGDQRLAELEGVRMAVGDVAAALLGTARADTFELGAARFDRP